MHYVHELAELQAAWDAVQERVTLVHVRGHAGDPANTLADEHANLVREDQFGEVSVRFSCCNSFR